MLRLKANSNQIPKTLVAQINTTINIYMLKIFLVMSEKLFFPYTHLDSQNSSDGVRFPFVRKLSFHDHQISYVLTVNSHFIRLKTSLHHHVRFVLKVLTPSNTATEQIRILFPYVLNHNYPINSVRLTRSES